MKNNKLSRLMAYMLTLCMLVGMFSGITFTVSAEAEPIAEVSGIEFSKTAQANNNGTVDITMEAYTTGTVTNESSAVPTDIILVLDVSGSMDEIANHEANRGLVYGEHYTYSTLFNWNVDAYGFNDNDFTYYKKNADESYTRLRYVGRDDNGFEYFTDNETRYYPILKDGLPSNRENNYDVIQFYRELTHMDILKDGASAFISVVEEKNAQITDDAKKHRISIVKFATADYWNGRSATDDHEQAVVGNNSNYIGYNYTQVVKDLTVVDADGETELLAAIDNLNPGGATAVDYGIQLAEDVLGDRPATEVIGRSEAVIVFTDGSPTHGSEYEENVAGSAISEALALKQAGVKIFSIGGADNADSSILGDDSNRFMHYISNNYPDASYVPGTDGQPGTIIPGEGSLSSGFYMTPSEDKNLESIFMDIFQQTVNLDITLGSTAGVIDTISPFFTIPDGRNSVTLQIAEKTASGWADAVSAEGVEPRINGKTLTVRGFDFDANYVSEAPRTVDGEDFYGKKLIITINVNPDYNEIDLHKDSFSEGAIPTNEGRASVVNSANEAVISVETPIVTAKKVTYIVDGEVYAYFYRFPGSNVNIVIDDPVKAGHTFSGWDHTSTFTMPDEDVEITGTFVSNEYDVTYVYSGVVPVSASPLPAKAENVAYGTIVTVAPDATADGYHFSGWTPLEQDVTVSNGTFTMPDHAVTLRGLFAPDDNTEYRIIHYLETMTDGVYEQHEVQERMGVTDTTATAIPKYYEGFTYDEGNANEVISGTITASPMLVLKLYYNRDRHKVTYSYSGDVPQDPPTLPEEKIYKFGETVTVADNVNVAGYTFAGWESLSTNAAAGETFTMPDHDVAFIGEFDANTDTPYKVEYYLENIAGDDFDLDAEASYENVGTTGSIVYANNKEFTGFTFDAANPDNKLSGTIAGDGSLVLKLYYKRNTYTITYAYEGAQPDGAPEVPVDDKEYRYGEIVTIEEDLILEGYTFAGWHSTGYTVGNDDVEFEMPARNVTLLGNFEPADGVLWKEEHYFEDLDGTYPTEPKYTFDHAGTTGELAEAKPIAEEPGFEFDDDYAGNIVSAEIAGDGSTILKFHYKRKQYSVSYKYDPAEQPTGAPALPETVEYKYGQEVTVEGGLTLEGYYFVGWYPEQSGVPISGTFEMPAYDVVFEGDFNPRSDTRYEVHHHLQMANGEYPADPDYINEHSGTTGEVVPAIPRNFGGYTLNRDASQMSGTVEPDGSLILDLFYDRIEYTVTYYVTGRVPDGVTAPIDGDSPYRHGEEVSVLPTLTPPAGITFVGWTPVAQSSSEASITIENGKFTMPMHNVRLEGRFSAQNGIPYVIRHWTEKAELDGYELYQGDRRVGTTGDEVTVYALIIPGFTNVTEVDNVVVSQQTANILGDGSLVINFYYDRNAHNVTYEYEGLTPDGTPPVPAAESKYFGTEVTVAAAAQVPGYTFSGWTSADQDVIISDGKFIMPDKAVVLKGRFTAKTDTAYKVQYHLQKLNIEETDVIGADTANPEHYELQIADTVDGIGTTGHTATAEIKHFDGFAARTDNVITAIIKGDGSTVIDLYYDRVTNPIEYHFYGEHPDHQDSELPTKEENVPYGVIRTVASNITCDSSHRHIPTDWASPHVAPGEDGKFKMPATKVDFYTALRHIYRVEYDLNGGVGAEEVAYGAIDVFAGTVIDVKPASTKSGYTFTGWKLDNTETIYNPDDEITVNQDIKLIAQYTRSGGGGGGGGGVTRYTLTYETNGGSAIEKETHNSGKVVELTKVPKKDGYIFDGWHLDSELSQDVDEVKMTKNITVYAAWIKDNGSAGNGHDTPEDLNGDDHFAYVVGYPDGTVRPNANIDRAEVTTIFFRLLKEEIRNANISEANSFNDISNEDWYNTAISTMTKLGIVKGRYTDRFVPDAAITRAEFATICARFDDSEFEIVDEFTDVAGHWAEAEIHEAAAHGWIRGYEDGTFKPDQFITRAEAMTMINRVLNRVPETADDLLDEMIEWPDNSNKAEWYYLPIQEATNSHDYDMKNHIYEKWTALREVADWTKYE